LGRISIVFSTPCLVEVKIELFRVKLYIDSSSISQLVFLQGDAFWSADRLKCQLKGVTEHTILFRNNCKYRVKRRCLIGGNRFWLGKDVGNSRGRRRRERGKS
jgi:hypothetical protein